MEEYIQTIYIYFLELFKVNFSFILIKISTHKNLIFQLKLIKNYYI